MSARFKSAIDAVGEIKRTLEDGYATFTQDHGTYEYCCQVDTAKEENNAHFNNKVSS